MERGVRTRGASRAADGRGRGEQGHRPEGRPDGARGAGRFGDFPRGQLRRAAQRRGHHVRQRRALLLRPDGVLRQRAHQPVYDLYLRRPRRVRPAAQRGARLFGHHQGRGRRRHALHLRVRVRHAHQYGAFRHGRRAGEPRQPDGGAARLLSRRYEGSYLRGRRADAQRGVRHDGRFGGLQPRDRSCLLFRPYQHLEFERRLSLCRPGRVREGRHPLQGDAQRVHPHSESGSVERFDRLPPCVGACRAAARNPDRRYGAQDAALRRLRRVLARARRCAAHAAALGGELRPPAGRFALHAGRYDVSVHHAAGACDAGRAPGAGTCGGRYHGGCSGRH